MSEPIDPRIRAYVAQYAEIAAESAIDHFEEFVFSALASLMESGATADVIEDICALMYECYRRGVDDGGEQAHEAWKLAERLVAEELQHKEK